MPVHPFRLTLEFWRQVLFFVWHELLFTTNLGKRIFFSRTHKNPSWLEYYMGETAIMQARKMRSAAQKLMLVRKLNMT